MTHVLSHENSATAPSRRLSPLDCQLSEESRKVVQEQFGGPAGHTCDLMALDSNVMKDIHGNPLAHFTPWPSPGSSGVNIFAQDLSSEEEVLCRPYVFPPLPLVGPLVRFLKTVDSGLQDCFDYWFLQLVWKPRNCIYGFSTN